jgi:hypothetical protein
MVGHPAGHVQRLHLLDEPGDLAARRAPARVRCSTYSSPRGVWCRCSTRSRCPDSRLRASGQDSPAGRRARCSGATRRSRCARSRCAPPAMSVGRRRWRRGCGSRDRTGCAVRGRSRGRRPARAAGGGRAACPVRSGGRSASSLRPRGRRRQSPPLEPGLGSASGRRDCGRRASATCAASAGTAGSEARSGRCGGTGCGRLGPRPASCTPLRDRRPASHASPARFHRRPR